MGLFDDVDSGTELGDITSGAAAGTALIPIPGVGTALGALAGGIGGLFSKKKKTPNFQDPYAAQRDLAVSDLMTGNYGQKAASVESGQIGNAARDEAMDFKNNSNYAGNANVQSAMENKILTNAERGSQSAYVRGAQTDSENRAKAAQLSGESTRMAQSQFELNQGYADRPSFGQQMLQSVLSTSAGLGLSKLTSPTPGAVDPSEETDPATTGTNSQGTGFYDRLLNSGGGNSNSSGGQSPSLSSQFNLSGSLNNSPASQQDQSAAQYPNSGQGNDWLSNQMANLYQ
jgi:hypothetical protein